MVGFTVDESFQYYSGGIYTPLWCGTSLNHARAYAEQGRADCMDRACSTQKCSPANNLTLVTLAVVIVGYSTGTSDGNFWIVRNSCESYSAKGWCLENPMQLHPSCSCPVGCCAHLKTAPTTFSGGTSWGESGNIRIRMTGTLDGPCGMYRVSCCGVRQEGAH